MMGKTFRLFSERENLWLGEVLQLLEKGSEATVLALQEGERRLQRMGELLTEYPSLSLDSASKPLRQNANVLVETLCNLNPLEMKLKMPSKALLADTYLMAKAQHFKEILFAIQELPNSEQLARVSSNISYKIEQIIHTYLLGQLLIDVILDEECLLHTKRNAARNLLTLWDQSFDDESLSGFFSLIRSMWDARLNIQVQYGTLLGASELLQLMHAECDPVILEFITNDDLTEEESWAFQEFLFGLLYEDLLLIRDKMTKHSLSAVSGKQVRSWLDLPDREISEKQLFAEDPHFIYRSYKQRRFRCRYRRNTASEGPKRTAEEFLVFMLLRSEQ